MSDRFRPSASNRVSIRTNPRGPRRGYFRPLRLEPLEERSLLATLDSFLTTEHVDLNIGYSGGPAGAWSLQPRDDDNAVSYAPDAALLYAGAPAQTTRAASAAFNFVGVGAGATFYRLPQAQNPNLLYLGAAGYGANPTDFDRYNPATESKGRVSGLGRWLKMTLLDVDHVTPAGTPGGGVFSVWQSEDTGPSVFLSSFNDGVSNPNGAGLDTTDGIGADDAMWIVAGGHSHFNWGFSEKGRYEVTVKLSGYLDDGNTTVLGQLIESGPLTVYFSVGSVGRLEFDAATYTVNEDGVSAAIKVRRVNGSDGRITVNYATSNGTATAGADYTATTGTLTFNDQEVERVFNIPINNDSAVEPNETVNLALSVPGPASIADYISSPSGDNSNLLGGQSAAVLTILDNDAPPANTPPTISDVGNQNTNEDTPTGPISFTVGDGQTPAASLIVTASSSNGTVVPSGNIALGGSGANRTVTITPAPDKSGTATITLTVTDGGGLNASDTFTLTVNPVNDAPLANPDDYLVGTGNAAHGNVLFNDVDVDGDPLTAAVVASPAHGNLTFQPDGSFRYLPGASFDGSDSFTYRASDGIVTTAPALVTISSAPARSFAARLTEGHTDIGVAFEDDEWDLHVHDEETDTEYEPDEVQLHVGPPALTTRPSGAEFNFIGVGPNQPFYRLPQTVNPELLFLGLGTEEIEEDVFQDDEVFVQLKSVNGPGHFSVWRSTDAGPKVIMATADGITLSDFFTGLAGGHEDLNWGFTAAGRYEVTLQAWGYLDDGDDLPDFSAEATYYFAVDVADPTGITASLMGNQLQVGGTAAADNIFIDQVGGAGGSVRVFDNGAQIASFAAAAVNFIVVNSGNGNDSITIDSTTNPVEARIGTQLTGDAGDDTINGGLGDDFINGKDGNDTLNGNAGNDTLIGWNFDSGNSGRDVMRGGAGIDLIQADFLDIDTAPGTPTVLGGDGPNNASAAFISGDELKLDSPGFVVTQNLNLVNDMTAGLAAGIGGFEIVKAGSGNDTLTVTNATANDGVLLIGGDGNDRLIGSLGQDQLQGDAGNDTLIGRENADVLIGGSGDDTLDYSGSPAGTVVPGFTAGFGNFPVTGVVVDLRATGPGIVGSQGGHAQGDTYRLDDVENVIGTPGNDYIIGNSLNNVLLDGGDGNDTIIGRGGNDNLIGGNGNDVLIGSEGSIATAGDTDTFDGGSGDDQIFADLADLLVGAGVGGVATPRILGGAGGTDILDFQFSSGITLFTNDFGGSAVTGGFEQVLGSAGNDRFETAGPAPNLYYLGRGGNDILRGGGGNDTLDGEDGIDTLRGGAGGDTFIRGEVIEDFNVGEGDQSFP